MLSKDAKINWKNPFFHPNYLMMADVLECYIIFRKKRATILPVSLSDSELILLKNGDNFDSSSQLNRAGQLLFAAKVNRNIMVVLLWIR